MARSSPLVFWRGCGLVLAVEKCRRRENVEEVPRLYMMQHRKVPSLGVQARLLSSLG